MDYIKYFKGDYELGKCDCWTLMQEIYKDEHDLDLPHYPFAIEEHEKDFAEFVKANLVFEPLDEPVKGAIVHYSHIGEHVGYALNNKQYIHRTNSGTKVNDIPKKYCRFYDIIEVLND